MAKRIRLKVLENYTKSLTELGMQRYLGHHKVIRFTSEGYPVYSISLPPLLSPAYANSEINSKYRVIQNRPLPNLASIALTDVCNAKCEHCSFFNSLDDKTKEPLSVEEMKDLLRQSQDLGVSVIDFVGGEPLMHPHWREIFESIDKRKSHVFIFTNGWFLAGAAADLRASGVGAVYVSLDASTAELHDRKRGLPGLFDKAMEGIAAAKKADLTVGISCCIDEEGFSSGELDNIIELGRKHGVHEVLVFDAMPVGRFQKRDDLASEKWSQTTWLDQMMEHVRKYNKDENYPGIYIYAYTTSYLSNGCTGGTGYFYVSPYGEVCPCDFHHIKYGDVREEKLYMIWDKMTRQLGRNGSNWTGCWAKQKKE
ncbi:MAG: radical SAM protein [Clostridiales bacterium]|nr:radical SAM protein [Clostridiales bacterium]